MSLSWEQVLGWRLERQHLDRRAPREEALAVVSRLCGLHAQVLSSAELTLWARVEDLEPDAVRSMLWEQRTLVKQWAMRGTLHLLPADELGLWHAALGTYDHFRKPSWSRAFGVSQDELDAIVEAIGAELEDAQLTRAQLAEAVAARAGAHLAEALTESWGALLKPAAFAGELCFAPDEGRNVRFTNPRTWVGAGAPVEDPLPEVARRFLAAYGPARREDLARWWATTPARAQKLLATVAQEVEVDGEPRWMLPGDVAAAERADAPTSVRLLPGFDQYVIGSTSHVERLLSEPSLKARVHRPQGWVSPVLLVDGRLAGVWRHERRGRRLVVSVSSFGRLRKGAKAEIEREIAGLAGFLGGDPRISWER